MSFALCLSSTITASKVSVFGVFLVGIFPYLDVYGPKNNPNTDTFHAVNGLQFDRIYNYFVFKKPFNGYLTF